MNYKSALLGAFPLILGSLLSPGQAEAATAVTINGQSCGNLTSLETTPTQVSISSDGNCAGGGTSDTPANVVDRTMAAVTEGTTGSLDVSAGVIVRLPYSVSIASQPGLAGASATASGNTVTYHAPPVGTVTADGTPDSFTYTVTDGSAAPNSVTATVNVTVNMGDNTSGACVNSSTIECKTPDLDISQTGGEIRYIARDAGITHVWTIPAGQWNKTYYGGTIGLRYVTASSLPVTISISDSYAADSTDTTWCTKVVDREEGLQLGYSEQYQYSCQLDPAKDYYFRVSGAKSGTYWLVW